MATRRDYAAEYRRRIARGKAKGLTRQEARGHKPPKGKTESQTRRERYLRKYPEASRQEAAGRRPESARERRRGERMINEFLDYIESGDGVMLADHPSTIKRLPDGRWDSHIKAVEPKLESRDYREFPMPPMTIARLTRLIDQELEAGAILSPKPSLDQHSLLPEKQTRRKR